MLPNSAIVHNVSLASHALLANLAISQWMGRKLDQRATDTVEAQHATARQVGNYTKKLLPGAVELDRIHKLSAQIRVFFYEQTLPWCNDGSRILASQNYLDFTEAFRKVKSDFDIAVMEFIREYHNLREDARRKLGDLFNDNDYPSAAKLVRLFSCEVNFMPIPDISDFRVQVTDDEKAAFLERMAETEKNAMQECWRRLYDVINKAAAKLSDPKAIYRDSLIENIDEMCKLLPKLNITGDAELESMRQTVASIAAGINPETCRDDHAARQSAALTLNDISAKMSAFMGE